MSYLQVQQLVRVKSELEVAQAAVDYLERTWARLREEPEFRNIEFPQVRLASASLEATYIVRLFSVFEGILREALPIRILSSPDRRNVYDSINRAASRWRISAAVRDEVHQVRAFRNLTVHQSSAEASTLLFADALAGLNRFLAWLP